MAVLRPTGPLVVRRSGAATAPGTPPLMPTLVLKRPSPLFRRRSGAATAPGTPTPLPTLTLKTITAQNPAGGGGGGGTMGYPL